MKNITIGFIGFGLIGGSIAKILKKNIEGIRIIAYNRSPEPLKQALDDGVIDESVQIDKSFEACDFIFLCTPVEYNSVFLAKLKPFVKKGAIVTDVGSVKGYIHETVRELNMEDCFIGGHPMAGSERTGYACSCEMLLENAFYAITPTSGTTQDMLARYIELVKATLAIPVVLDPEKHDYSVAGISHVPHVIAAGLVNLVQNSDDKNETMKLLAAGGFKDITRIASSSPKMWEQICTTNTDAICSLLEKYITSLEEIKEVISRKDRDAINDFFSSAREYRNSVIDSRKGPIISEYLIYCDIEDREGALLSVIEKLTANHISIRNIEIVNNRESESGVLKISVGSDKDRLRAIDVLGNGICR